MARMPDSLSESLLMCNKIESKIALSVSINFVLFQTASDFQVRAGKLMLSRVPLTPDPFCPPRLGIRAVFVQCSPHDRAELKGVKSFLASVTCPAVSRLARSSREYPKNLYERDARPAELYPHFTYETDSNESDKNFGCAALLHKNVETCRCC